MRVDSLLPSTNELPWDLVIEEPLERCLTKSLLITELESGQVSSIPDIGESILVLDESEEETIVIEDQKTINGLTIKELPKHLRYAFLGENDTKPLIIYVALMEDMEHRLLEVQRRNMGAFAW